MGNCFATQVLDIDHTPCPKKYSGPSQVPPALKKFTLAELSAATGNFRPASAIGSGGFGGVFRGWVDEKTYAPSQPGSGIAVAVKRLNPDGEQGIKEWEAEIRFLGKFSHPNLVKLLGYCGEDNEFLLVYEYMKKRSLDNHLFKGKGVEPLSWETRLKIVIGAANGLAFLHSSEKCVIYRDFKAANILLDENYNAKLSDFGLAKFGPVNGDSHLTTDTMPMGSHGYAAPEYIATGHLYVKSDVYGFGVVLLEMLTGMKVIDLNRPNGQQNLVLYSRPFLKEERRLRKIVDPRLEGKYPTKGAKQVAQLVLECLVNDPKKRPSMEEVLETLQRISCIKNTPSYNEIEIEQTASPLNRKCRGSNRSPLHSMRGGASYKTRGH